MVSVVLRENKTLALYRITIHCEFEMAQENKSLTDADYGHLADFRYELRRFLDFSANAAACEGLTGQQHQALLAIRGNATPPASVGFLAERLLIRPNTAAELAQRLEQAGLITKTTNKTDRRAMDLELTAEGSRRLEALTLAHRRELSQLRPAIVELLGNLDKNLG